MLYGAQPPDTNVHLESKVGDLASARRHAMKNACTAHDEDTDTYKWRPLFKTTVAEIGEYGLGFLLYFNFLKMSGGVLFVMALLSTGLIALSYLGDFGGVTAGFFAKTTIGNLGVCGQYGELCPQVTSYPYRFLLAGNDLLVRNWTPVFGALAAAGTGLYAIFSFWFYYRYRPRMKKLYDDRHITPTDYAVEAELLPSRLVDDKTHMQYEELLRAHFEKVAGAEGCVVEVALARDYDGAIRRFLRIHALTVEIRELKARVKRSPNARRENSLLKQIRKLELERAACEAAVTKEALVEENTRNVCKAFITFTELRLKKRVVEAYRLSTSGFLLRLIQSRALRFMGKAIRVQDTSEPINVYHENLDISRRERFLRKAFTIFAAIVVLFGAFFVLLFAQTAIRTGQSQGVPKTSTWVISNTTPSTGLCFESCGIEFYEDPNCQVSINATVVGTFESSGIYTAGETSLTSKAGCTIDNVWRSDRCEAVEAWREPWFFQNPGSVAPPRVGHLSKSRALNELPHTAKSVARSAFTSLSMEKSSGMPGLKAAGEPPLVLPDSTPICPLTHQCLSADLDMCFDPASQRCDGVWNCLLSGFDEELKADNSVCPAVCSGLASVKCPATGKCVDIGSDTCGATCLGRLEASSATCAAIADRISTVKQLKSCDRTLALQVATSNFGGACPTKFALAPCCVLNQLTTAQKTALSTCSAASVIDDVSAIYAGLSALGYMERYCRSFQRTSSNGGGVSAECSSTDINTVITVSSHCYAAAAYNRNWCECLSEIPLLDPTMISRLESCQVNEYEFFGVKNGYNHLNNFLDVVRLSCQESRVKRGMNDQEKSAPLLVFTTQVSSALTAEDLLNQVVQVLSPLAFNGYVSLVVTEDGIVRFEIDDRSDATDPNIWTKAVVDTYDVFKAELDISYPTRSADRIVIEWETHCPESSMFQCPITRKCLDPVEFVCDGVPDCEIVQNGSAATDDELDCPVADSETVQGCADNEFQCVASKKCIPYLFWCDGLNDCSDSSDETGSDCELQKTVRNKTNTTSSLSDPHLGMEYIGFHFSEPVLIQCAVMHQPQHSLATVVDVYSCNEEVVFQEGRGLVLRYPDLNCIKVQAASLNPLEESTRNNAVLNPSNMVYNVFGPDLDVGCDNSTASRDTCPILTGDAFAYCDNDVCKHPIASSKGNFTILSTPICDFGTPISPAVAKILVLNYTDANSGEISSNILEESTYSCFCEQQAQYQSGTNTLFAFPPYSTDIQQMCAKYYNKQIANQLIRIAGVTLVAIVNIILTIVMYWLSDFERSVSLTDKAASELWKLFMAQFVNAGLLVLLVNWRFYDAGFTFAGFGEGDYPDTTREWFAKIGSNLCLSMFVLMFTNTVPMLLWEGFARCLRRRSARKKLTQEAMNKALELPDYKLSLRIATYMTSLAVTVMYSGPMPIMLWTATLTAFVLYWYDKFFFLRCCGKPAMQSDSTMVICMRLMPVVIVASLAFMIWTMSSQEVFPSDPVNQSWYESLSNEFDENSIILFITGRLNFLSRWGTYRDYIKTRLSDSLRKAPFGGVVVLGLIALFFVYRILWFLLTYTIITLVRFLLFVLGCFRQKPSSRNMLQRAYTSLGGKNIINDVEPHFNDAKELMERNNLLYSYKIQEHPQYKAAHAAMNRVKRQSIRHSIKMANEVPVPEQQTGARKKHKKKRLIIHSDSSGGEEPVITSPKSDQSGGLSSRIEPNINQAAYPSLDEGLVEPPVTRQRPPASSSQKVTLY